MSDLDITHEYVHAWDADLCIEHAKNIMEFLIINDGVGPILVHHPVHHQPMQNFAWVGTSCGKFLHDLGLIRLWNTESNVFVEVASRQVV